jgi:hypothetical protein
MAFFATGLPSFVLHGFDESEDPEPLLEELEDVLDVEDED